ncbi:acyl-ACP--UDP-N-acetylglucosamine O-acyltransferase family protein [Agromyces silvae]|uniref:UDP-N-acetylglucosamine acyltransferase n=1 Tax=Agromyces silvae TaxID=3388266 RepID=UPI00280B5F2D|nr:UDP-N-acetylglucosamine acyltransferase [Agromyces protaetiae]
MSNRVHPSAIVGERVRLGSGNTIGPFAVLMGEVELGDDNWIGAGVVIGATPEIRSVPHPADALGAGRGVRLGSRNVVREYAQVHAGSEAPTVVGDDAFIMNQVYIAHDCSLGDGVTLASSVLLAGHVRIGSHANLGLGTSVHQRRSVGDGAMVGMSSTVTRDIPPFAKAYGNPARVRGGNVVGGTRLGGRAETAEAVDRAYAAGELASAERLVRVLRDEIATRA